MTDELATLPDINDARLPTTYVRAVDALEKCQRADECKTWADKAAALASYARQSHDETLEKMAKRIRVRAIRRCGELLKQVEAGQTGPRVEGRQRPATRTEAAADVGILS